MFPIKEIAFGGCDEELTSIRRERQTDRLAIFETHLAAI